MIEQADRLIIKDIPHEIRPQFARVIGEVIGYNREVMDINGEGATNGSIVRGVELRTGDYGNDNTKFLAVGISNGGVSGAGNRFMLEGCFEELDLGALEFGYDCNSMPSEKVIGVFDLTAITKRHEGFVNI